ncbi:MAG: UvrD-helicase domain-containing protein, partial [Thermoleophilia bacterium]|nr:UvrD-helicase domain-containing protein [Thermoleophilia bacterium]
MMNPAPRSQRVGASLPDAASRLAADLNDRQREAVFYEGGPLLVLAGAGSGKTRVLTYRLAYLIASGQAGLHEVLAVTFTNKAAGEMKERVARLLGAAGRHMWVCTFHSACARILRQEAFLLGYQPNFTIYDEEDSGRLIKRCAEELRLDSKRFSPRVVQHVISDAKSKMLDAEDFARSVLRSDAVAEGWAGEYHGGRGGLLAAAAEVYRLYQRRLQEANALDFDDLLMCTVALFRQYPERLAYYRDLFRHVLVDEYQDTNRTQYELVKLLTAEHRQVTVVGDDDQSVYSWRGADIRNILEFEKDFPDAKVIKLEQNYRSYTTILEAANAIVAHNRGRKPKRLWSKRGPGNPVVLFECEDEHEEARLVCNEIVKLLGLRPASDIAVFYRINAQSRVLEDMLVRLGVPYRVIGGTKFYQRAEIKDLLAYLRVVVNPADSVSLLRIINTPRRGLGAATIGRLQMFAAEANIPLRETLLRAEEVPGFSGGVVRTCLKLGNDFARWADRAARPGAVADLVRAVLVESGLREAL